MHIGSKSVNQGLRKNQFRNPTKTLHSGRTRLNENSTQRYDNTFEVGDGVTIRGRIASEQTRVVGTWGRWDKQEKEKEKAN